MERDRRRHLMSTYGWHPHSHTGVHPHTHTDSQSEKTDGVAFVVNSAYLITAKHALQYSWRQPIKVLASLYDLKATGHYFPVTMLLTKYTHVYKSPSREESGMENAQDWQGVDHG